VATVKFRFNFLDPTIWRMSQLSVLHTHSSLCDILVHIMKCPAYYEATLLKRDIF